MYVNEFKKERDQVQTETVKFIALLFSFSSILYKIWSFHVIVVRGRQRIESTAKKSAASVKFLFLFLFCRF